MASEGGAISRVSQELARAAQAARLGRHVEIDGAAMAAVIDAELRRLLRERRAEILQSLSHRLSRAMGMVGEIRSGITVHDPSAAALELSAVAGSLRLIAAVSEASRAA